MVRTPCSNIRHAITSAGLGEAEYATALAQHGEYIDALEACGLEVIVLPADQDYPDSTFIEDTALLLPECAIITNPGAAARKGEVTSVKSALNKIYTKFEYIFDPGTAEGGDVLKVGSHYFIGLSQRTNREGAEQLIRILNRYGRTGSMVELEKVLHLKTGVAYLEDNNLLACGEFLEKPEFQKFNILPITEDEGYAANCVWINGTVLMPRGFPKAKKMIDAAGYPIMELEMSEFRKADGGLSCISLRF
jgi:dimethylargininase